jgi:hypothetical protein
VRAFLRLLYATFERVGGSAFGIGSKPNFYGARRLVQALLAINAFTLCCLGGALLGRRVLAILDSTAVGIAAVAVIAAFVVWMTRGLEDSPATMKMRAAIDQETPDQRRSRRIKIGTYAVASIGLFVAALQVLRSSVTT